MSSEAWTQLALIAATVGGIFGSYFQAKFGAAKIKEVGERDVEIATLKAQLEACREKIADRDRHLAERDSQIEQLEAERAGWPGRQRPAPAPSTPAKGPEHAV